MANEKKEKAIKSMVKWLKKLAPGNKSIAIMEEHLTSMSDKDFHQLMVDARDGKWTLPIYAENMTDQEINKDTALDVAEALGLELVQRLVLKDPDTDEFYTTPEKFLVVDLPVRRLVQHLDKKKSFPENSKKIDHLSGQVTGESKGASMSAPEIVLLKDKGFDNSITELIKVRGGDETAYRSMFTSVKNTGGFSLGPIEDAGSNVKANETLSAILFAMHLDNNLIE